MKYPYIISGIRFENLVKLVMKNGISFKPRYLFRLLFLIQNGIWASIFSFKEKRVLSANLEMVELPRDPIFIIGHWRTGSTFLHQLMNLDPGLEAPTLLQTAMPESFISSRHYYEPIIEKMLSKNRPWDNVRLGLNEPMEDEFALFRLTGYSPLEKVVFPSSTRYFLLENNFLPNGSLLSEWENKFCYFCKKLSFQAPGKQLLFKNPFHSLRIKLLNRLFPDAHFIHIFRHPHNTVFSTIRMWNIINEQNALKTGWKSPTVTAVATVLDNMLSVIRKDLSGLSSNKYSQVKFEDLEQKPLEILAGIYHDLGMNFSSDHEKKVKKFLDEIKNFKKSDYSMPMESRDLITSITKRHMEYYGYE